MSIAPRTAAGRALLGDVTLFGPNAEEVLHVILAIEDEAYGEGMFRQLERQLHDEQNHGKTVVLGSSQPQHEHDPDVCDECQEMVMEALRD